MCVWLFNPPEPSCQPTDKRALGSKGQSQCGLCNCVPPFWKVTGTPGTPYAGLFMPQVLPRNVALFETDLSEPCQWTIPVNLYPVANTQAFYGSMTLVASPTNWSLILVGNPAIGGLPADVAVYNQLHFNFDSRPFRCLSANTFGLDDSLGSGNFTGLPQTVVVQPFWP